MKNSSETKAMMEMFAQNPQKGFEQIYKNFAGPIFRYLKNSFSLTKEEAEDIIHSVFLPWVKEPEKFARVENPAAYLFTSARNAAFKHKTGKMPAHENRTGISDSHELKVENSLIINSALTALPEEQKEALWNQPPSTAKLSVPGLLAAIIVVLAILIYAGSTKTAEKPLQNQSEVVPQKIPEFGEDPLPLAIIAEVEEDYNLGSYRFMKNKSDDFNLSFAQDSSSQTMLGFARELNNI